MTPFLLSLPLYSFMTKEYMPGEFFSMLPHRKAGPASRRYGAGVMSAERPGRSDARKPDTMAFVTFCL